ncbi:hypothetical protein SASPL_109163 [Salvia splendens]|uniref:Vacuole membrane protein KMS1 n=1 Tax=Salvia splendens TaxID=180675 RepID=A0A8X8YK42_SALSN|nr:hypothetical protein SASPL_109163 [Salvia splendens]
MASNEILNSDSISGDRAMPVSGLHEKHRQDLDNLTLTSQPFKTLKLFILAVMQYIRKFVAYMLSHGGWLILLTAIVVAIGTLFVTVEGPHGKHVEEIQRYVQFMLWWVALGVASSIGLDSVRIPLSRILPQVQLEAILWGLGTALGELPPYFISRAARLSGDTVDAMEELDASSAEDKGFLSTRLNQIKRRFLSHAQYLNFFTILILASVPNPLFDLAGIMCGQFGIPFWEFFLATVIGKAIIKTHIQTVFIISVCNNQLLHWMENELLWLSSKIPGFSSVMPKLIANLHSVKYKYLSTKPEPPTSVKAAKWDFSLTSIWNTVVWIMLINFFVKIVNSTAQSHLKREQDQEIAAH